MRRLLSSVLLIPLFWLTACDSWLDIVPEEDITTLDTEFETREDAEDWLRSCYLFLQGPLAGLDLNEAFFGADEFVGGDYIQNQSDTKSESIFPGFKIATGMQNSLIPYCDRWSKKETDYTGTDLWGRSDYYTAINMCNIFIDKVDNVYTWDDMEKRERKGEVIALKAYYYFELVRRYGPIILVPKNIDPNVDVSEMKVPRSHVDTCFKAIVQLCDEAAKMVMPFNMKETSRRGYFCKEAVLALKARALLYQASPLFNGNPDFRDFKNKNGEPLFSSSEDKEKWHRAAEAAAVAIRCCEENGKGLVKGQVGKTDLLGYMKNIEGSTTTFNFTSDEALFMIKSRGTRSEFYVYTLPRTKTGETYLAGACVSPSMKMVEMFYTENGLPIDQDPTYSTERYGKTTVTDPKYTDVIMMNVDIPYLHTRREPRFYADIAADRTLWQLGLTTDHLYKIELYQGEMFGLKETRINSQVPQNLTGYFCKKWTYSSCALHNYGNDMSSRGNRPFAAIRVAELYLIAAEAYNECGEISKAYEYLNPVRVRAGIPEVEDSWAMARDKNKVKTLSGLRQIIQQEWNIEFAFEGMRFWNLRRWKTAHIELNDKLLGWVVTGKNYNEFYNGGKGPVIVSSKNRFVAPRDYFWPIQSEEVLTSGCVQNLGW